MAITSENLRKLAALDLSPEQMAGVLDLLADFVSEEEARADAIEKRRAADRERKRKSRGSHADGHSDIPCDGHEQKKEKKKAPPDPPKEKNKKNNTTAREADEIIAELGRVVSLETALAVIDHRRKIKKPLTVRAARGLASRYAQCRDGPEAAAEYHLTHGNQGFEPEWYDNAKRKNSDSGQAEKSRYDRFLRGDTVREPDGGSSGPEPGQNLRLIEGRRALGAG